MKYKDKISYHITISRCDDLPVAFPLPSQLYEALRRVIPKKHFAIQLEPHMYHLEPEDDIGINLCDSVEGNVGVDDVLDAVFGVDFETFTTEQIIENYDHAIRALIDYEDNRRIYPALRESWERTTKNG